MRKGTAKIQESFLNREPMCDNNTAVVVLGKVALLALHGHPIARLDSKDNLSITLAGHNTAVTRERLNGLRGLQVHTSNGTAYLNGNPWNGKWTEVK